jgi:hypothetical protein
MKIMFASPTPGCMSTQAFAMLGESRLAYIKVVRSEEVAFLCAEAPLLPPGQRVFVLHGADGSPILLAGTREAAMADAASRQIETLSLH